MVAQLPEPLMWPTVREAAARFGVSPSRIRQLILDQTLMTRRIGNTHVIDPESLAAYERRRNALDKDTIGRVIDGRKTRWQPA